MNVVSNNYLEVDNYTWQKDKDTGEYTNEPVDTYNHCIDSLRYSVERFYRPVRNAQMSVRKLTQ